jgi:uncharacterized protein YgfB (UPF0149 family)
MVARAGAGPDPIPHKQLTADKLAEGINFCLRPESLERAKELASKIAAERGSDTGAQSFHQYLEVDRLRCTLAPSRAAAWRIKRTQVRLSAFAACTLANANLLDFHDLKLFRAQEYYTDEGPWDPVSGGFTTACRSVSNMGKGLAELPTETLKALQMPFRPNRQQPQTSVPTSATIPESSDMGGRSTRPTSVARSQTSSTLQKPLPRTRSPPHLSGRSYSTSNITPSSSSHPQSLSRTVSSSSKDPDMMHQTAHTSKGIGRLAKALVQSPMELSIGIARGFHNTPRLWGDDTVRPQERVSDFKSGIKAAGKEFGYGWYDGVTGMVTQPWKGAQKEGVAGFVKGIGKGVGGIIAKPGAAMLGILGHSMKGVHKEVQKMYGSNVQNYIVASRVAQGYEEWLLSSDTEKEDVIVRWKLIQKYLKQKRSPDEMVRDVLEAQQTMSMEGRHSERSAQLSNSADVLPIETEGSTRAMVDSQVNLRPADTAHEETLGATEVNETIQLSAHEASIGQTEDDTSVRQSTQEEVSRLQRQQQEAADEETLRQAIAFSEAESRRQANEALEYEKELKRAMEQSLGEQKQRSSDSEWELDMGLEGEEEANFERGRTQSGKTAEHSAAVACVQHSLSYDQGHLGGTTQSEFEAHQRRQEGEKSTQEKTEEEIVMEYVKKQSLLESYHRNKGKARATVTADMDDEDLQKALDLSMQENGHDTRG